MEVVIIPQRALSDWALTGRHLKDGVWRRSEVGDTSLLHIDTITQAKSHTHIHMSAPLHSS